MTDTLDVRKKLEYYAELFAYIMFANMHTNHLYKSLTVSDISGFVVYIYFNEYEPEIQGEDPIVEMNCRITIKGNTDKDGKKKEDTQVMYVQEEYFNAVIDQIYESTGAFQHYEYEFGVPNELKLYDAEFLIEEKLGIDLDEE